MAKATLDKDPAELTAIVITTKDGKEFKIDGELPVKAFRLFEANVQIIPRMLPDNSEGLDPETFDKASKALTYVIHYANKIKWPVMTPEYIDEQFDPADLRAIILMYLNTWMKTVNAERSVAVAPKE
jgi:hypothetical protein